MNSIPCTICKEEGHTSRKCPTLVDPLKPGFYSGGGAGGHAHGDDDESICDDGYWTYDFYAFWWRILC